MGPTNTNTTIIDKDYTHARTHAASYVPEQPCMHGHAESLVLLSSCDFTQL